jgi:low affinity Fe/Cu permease
MVAFDFDRISRATASAAGSPWAFALAVAAVALWAGMGSRFNYSDTWELVINTGTTIVTFLMVFLIQATQNRSEAAIQLKLDEIVRAIDQADNRLIGIDKRSEQEITEVRTSLESP